VWCLRESELWAEVKVSLGIMCLRKDDCECCTTHSLDRGAVLWWSLSPTLFTYNDGFAFVLFRPDFGRRSMSLRPVCVFVLRDEAMTRTEWGKRIIYPSMNARTWLDLL
jgi:hypothetical protein